MQPSFATDAAQHDDMRFECSGRMILIRCGKSEPSEAAWRKYLSVVRTRTDAELRGLVVTTGGSPSMAQQKAFVETVAGRTVPFAIMTDNVKVRFVTSMLAMVSKRIRSFALSDVDGVCEYLDLTPDERQRVRAFVAATPTRRSVAG